MILFCVCECETSFCFFSKSCFVVKKICNFLKKLNVLLFQRFEEKTSDWLKQCKILFEESETIIVGWRRGNFRRFLRAPARSL